ncbi:MAG: hypothetical protein OEZ04_11980 [Nitrospinota bacterium]|nr:hypothetical protein [Nitrospinota bacterium]
MTQRQSNYLLDELIIRGKRMTLVGILHTKEEFERNKESFEFLMKPYSAVMLEQPLWYKDFSYDTSSFGQLAGLALKMNKRVYIADPFDPKVLAADMAFGVLGLGMLVKSFKDLAKATILRDKHVMNRGGFLARFAALGIGAPLFLGSLMGMDLRAAVDMRTSLTWGLDDKYSWGSKDWRDLWIAIGIGKVLENVDDVYSMIAFHGVGHQRGIQHYLDQPQDMAKEKYYMPFERISSRLQVREYTPKKYIWQLTRKI